MQKDDDGAPSLGATLDGLDVLTDLGVTDINLNLTAYARMEAGGPGYFEELEQRIVPGEDRDRPRRGRSRS